MVAAGKKVVLISEDNRELFPEDTELKSGIIEYLVPEHFREPEEEVRSDPSHHRFRVHSHRYGDREEW